MRFGLGEATIQGIRSVLAGHPAVERAVLYGSRAKGTHKPGSDIDLALYGKALSHREQGRILEELDALDLPYDIDLTVFDQLAHAGLREHIERVGVVLYSRSGGE